MNRLLILGMGLICSFSVFSQQFSLSTNIYGQFAYLEMDNQISCTVEGIPNKSIVLTTDNGTISKISKKSNNYIYRPSRISDSKITISRRNNGKLKKIADYYVMVRDLPSPVIHVGGVKEREIEKNNFLAQQGVGCSYVIPGFCLPCTIDSFSVTVLDDTIMVFHKANKGNIFSGEIRALLKSVEKGDTVIFSGIIYLTPDKRRKNANPIEYVIQ
jgi:hypothetical protein